MTQPPFDDREFDAIVIGGGIAGLTAARELERRGKNCLLLEARGRLGGRIHTVNASQAKLYPIELGAEFIHGKPPMLIEEADRFQLPLCRDVGDQWSVKDGKLISAKTFWQDVEKIFSAMDSEEGCPDRSFRQFLNGVQASDEDKAAALRYVEGFNAAEADRLGMQGLIQSCRAETELGGDDLIYRLIGGYGPLIEAIAGELKRTQIRINTVVKKIQWQPGQVIVHGQSAGDETIVVRGKTAVITLPLGVLQQPEAAPNAVRFEPELESKQSALKRLVMGKVIRVALLFKTRFWDSVQVPGDGRTLETLNFLHNAENKYFPTWWTQTPIRMPVLVAWSSGHFAENLANLSDAQITRHAVDALCSWMPAERPIIEAELLQCYLHNWQSDPFSQGAYSYPGVGGKEAQVELAQPVQNTLFFAGEATETEGSFATVHGAMKTGLRAAQEAQKALSTG